MAKAYKCPKCGARVYDTMPQCTECGKKFAWDKVQKKTDTSPKSKGFKECSPFLQKNRFIVRNLSFISPIFPILCLLIFKNYAHSMDVEYQRTYANVKKWALTSFICWTLLIVILMQRLVTGLQQLDINGY